ncbi:MAG TPA: primase-helicase family protein, partial [Geminicoccaceae bacterium]|nr:primase-helicase family protein [Geminicoccaceae bacterium]
IASLRYDAALGRERLVFSRREDVKLLYEHRHHLVGHTSKGNEIWKDLGSAWLAHRFRRNYREIALVPEGPCPPDVFNLWRGFGVEPKAGTWGTLKLHLRSVVCAGNEEHYRWLLGWLAYCVQNPGNQAEVAVVLRGLKGTGKGMLGRLLMRVFRNHCLHITNPRHLVGNFNAHLVDALFLFLAEAFWAGDKQGEGTLKALITERSLMIEPKGMDSFQMPNRLKILMASNNDWVVPASAGERRYLLLDVSDAKKGDQAYFTRLSAAIEGDELAALLHDLLRHDLAGWEHRAVPHTAALDAQKLISADSFARYWHDCLAAGYLLNTGEADWPGTVVCQVLHAGYVEHAHQHGDRHPLTIDQLGVRLRQLSPDGVKTSRPHQPWNGVARPNRYLLRGLDEHRAAFLAAMRIDPAHHRWPEEP